MTSSGMRMPGAGQIVPAIPNERRTDLECAINLDVARKQVQKLQDELNALEQCYSSASPDDKPFCKVAALEKAAALTTTNQILLEYEREEARREAARQRQLATASENTGQFMMVIIEHHNDGHPAEAPPSYEEATGRR
ncbi:hypothetical protein RS75_21465 [Rhizobium nepotum 39/7]|jgi:hypothetical protein|uniref:Uncharacterized protein n=4 Tax=Rhizobium/Agrobacterium group TaxID=227290 RepID=A0ABR5CLW4_9HYPH|nr:hypothetical protein RS75_21465 [Rhizobium nepotum 39/7]KJF70961.1 hypothetical protein RP75_23595 [Agrobacterium arsenijevicii]